MQFFDIFLVALALSVDAFIVSFSYGLVVRKNKTANSLKLGLSTGLGQCLMPLIGWFGTKSVYQFIEPVDHWIAFGVFLALGLKVIADSLEDDCGDETKHLQKNLTFKILLMIGIATSIDALVMGGTLFFMGADIFVAAPVIGLTTFICSVIGFHLNCFFKKIPTKYMEIGAGLILIALGCKVLYEHLSV